MKIQLISTFLVLLLIVSACKKGDTGPAGPQGPQGLTGPAGPAGAQGPQGVSGNANVRLYTYGSLDFINNQQIDLSVTTTLDTMNRSAWLVYLNYTGGNEYYYMMPGYGYGATSYYRSTFSFDNTLNKVIHSIVRLNGTGEVYTGAKIIRIYANTVTAGGRMMLPSINYSNYEEVKRFYNLKD